MLSEKALAILHDGDTYFTNAKLQGWQLWYCLDNDITRFAWADATNGKGVVYRMIDEFGNDCPYDFKKKNLMARILAFPTLHAVLILRISFIVIHSAALHQQ